MTGILVVGGRNARFWLRQILNYVQFGPVWFGAKKCVLLMRILHAFKVYAPDHHGGIVEAIARITAGTPEDDSASLPLPLLRAWLHG